MVESFSPQSQWMAVCLSVSLLLCGPVVWSWPGLWFVSLVLCSKCQRTGRSRVWRRRAEPSSDQQSLESFCHPSDVKCLLFSVINVWCNWFCCSHTKNLKWNKFVTEIWLIIIFFLIFYPSVFSWWSYIIFTKRKNYEIW